LNFALRSNKEIVIINALVVILPTADDQTITRLRGICRHTSAKVVINAERCHRTATAGIIVPKPDFTQYYRRTRTCLWNGTTICQARCRPMWRDSVKRGVGFLVKLRLRDGQYHEHGAPTHLSKLRQRVFWSNGILSGLHASQGSR